MPESASPLEDLARGALLEITPADTVGAYFDQVDEGDGAVSLLFDSAMPGYPDWKWTVSIATIDGETPTVLEAELMPGDGALLSPDWVPWSDRLADYKAAQDADEGSDDDTDSDDDDSDDSDDEDDTDDDDSDDDEDEDDSDDDDDESDDDDDDELNNDVLHSGDLDGVDIDSLDVDDDSDEDDESDDNDHDEQDKSY
ncbi:DUF3027 domain-containing protein [Salinibacterium sp.]|uniref:DUF3027 domain-containing protein n=1 Tax=Salinibacterium sp. TaxID=1915057 RepID=UPI00286B8113|nr:DUF3027 domain-containing protein [Salinibacterium sp.]